MVIDPISDLIVSLKNASNSRKEVLEVPYTKLTNAVLETLQKVGFVENVEKQGKKISKKLLVELKYEDANPKITDVKRVSKYSKRIYKGAKEITAVKNGYGVSILSTPKGILSNTEARKANVGGEVLFEIW